MSDLDVDDIGNSDGGVEGNVDSRKVQTGGRVNVPDDFLEYIGVGENDRVLVAAEDGKVTIRPATAEALAATALVEGLKQSLQQTTHGKRH